MAGTRGGAPSPSSPPGGDPNYRVYSNTIRRRSVKRRINATGTSRALSGDEWYLMMIFEFPEHHSLIFHPTPSNLNLNTNTNLLNKFLYNAPLNLRSRRFQV